MTASTVLLKFTFRPRNFQLCHQHQLPCKHLPRVDVTSLYSWTGTRKLCVIKSLTNDDVATSSGWLPSLSSSLFSPSSTLYLLHRWVHHLCSLYKRLLVSLLALGIQLQGPTDSPSGMLQLVDGLRPLSLLSGLYRPSSYLFSCFQKRLNNYSNGSTDVTALPLACPQSDLDPSAYSEDCLSMILYIPTTLRSDSACESASTLVWSLSFSNRYFFFLIAVAGFTVDLSSLVLQQVQAWMALTSQLLQTL